MASLLTFYVQRLHHIVVDQLKVLVADPVLHVPLPACEEVVHHGHLMAVHHQLVGEVGTHKAGATRDLGDGGKTQTMSHGRWPQLIELGMSLVYFDGEENGTE